jgi:MoaA/NifB/PqqE/SkfB family radical SAM enzyme
MSYEGRNYDLYRSPLLKASAFLEGGKVRIDAKGPLAHLPQIKSSLQMFDGQIPALAAEKLFLSTWIPPIPSPAFDRLTNSLIKAIFGLRTPDQVTISITEECPNMCAHCALPDSGQKLRLSPEVAKDLISQILDLGTTLVIFDGGEPTLYRELPELVESVDGRAISTMFTSGAGFTASLAQDLKAAGLYAVNVSLDSPMEDEHDAMRGREGVFEEAMHAMENASHADLLVDIYVVLRHENVRHLQKFHELAKEMGAHEVTFFEVVPTGRWANRRDITLSSNDLFELNSFVSAAKSPRIFSVPEAYKRFGCFAAKSWMHVTPSGEVYPCACYPEQYGNIFEEPLGRIWQRMSGFPHKGSKSCPMRKD